MKPDTVALKTSGTDRLISDLNDWNFWNVFPYLNL